MNEKIDQFLANSKKWQEEMKFFREITLSCGLEEELKWRLPCYSLEGGNVAIIQPFKEYCALMFFKGALLKDPKKILKTPGSHQSSRQIRITNMIEAKKLKTTIKAYVKEAIKIEKSGEKVKLKKTSDFKVPTEFKEKLAEMPKLKKAFDSLTPGRQRAYLYFFSSAKQSATREARVEKYIPQILKGKGMND